MQLDHADSDSGTLTMRAVVRREYGGPDVLEVAQVERPQIAPDEVLVRVHAAGLDRGTWHLMYGLPYMYRSTIGLRRPKDPGLGLDLAGTVVATGAAVTRFARGDEVFGIGKGSFAEYAAAKESKLVPKPAQCSFEQAAVVPVSGLTAFQALRKADVVGGRHVLVLGASGGVGSFTVALAKHSGAEVTGVCSTAKLDLVRDLGADHVLDYTREDFAATPGRYDTIIDIGGRSGLSRLRRALAPRGTLVVVGGEGGGRWTGGFGRLFRAAALSPFVRQRLRMLVSKECHEDLEPLAELLATGELVPHVDRVYPLAETAAAMARLDAGAVRAKVAISM